MDFYTYKKKRMIGMDDNEFVSYKDISELKKELEGMKGKSEISNKELYDGLQRLANTIGEMLDVFSAASAQLKLEDREFEAESRKHDIIVSKLDKVLDQNKTIAEGMVAIVEMIKERMIPHEELSEKPAEEKEETLFKAVPMPSTMPPARQEWQPRPEPMMPRPMPRMMPPLNPVPMPQTSMPSMPPGNSDFGMELPPMGPEPSADLDFPDLNLDEEPKKKGLFGMFKK